MNAKKLVPLLVVAVGLVLPAVAAVASSTAPRPVYQAPQSYYLALGDSITYGFQPTKANPGLRPSAFETGYVDVFAARLRKLSPKIQVVNYGCPGESSVTFTQGRLPHARRRREAARRVSRIPTQGGPVLPASSPRAGQSDHPDAVGQRPVSAVAERQARAERDRVVRFALQLDPSAASGRRADR